MYSYKSNILIIPVIYWLCKAGDSSDNRFGDNPLAEPQLIDDVKDMESLYSNKDLSIILGLDSVPLVNVMILISLIYYPF